MSKKSAILELMINSKKGLQMEAKELNIKFTSKTTKNELAEAIYKAQTKADKPKEGESYDGEF